MPDSAQRRGMLRTLLRYVLGAIFLVSGLVKAIDPVGFSFKLEEYFSPAVLNLPFLEPFALLLAAIISASEALLGLFLLTGRRLKTVLNILIGLCVFFAFLTFYSAYFNKVIDCGCFGDALKLTPWMSFAKDIILLMGLLMLRFSKQDKIQVGKLSLIPEILGAATLFFVLFWGLTNEPLIDFRDYKVGTDLAEERRKAAENPPVFTQIYHLKNQKNQAERVVAQEEFLQEKELWQPGTDWKILPEKTETKLQSAGYETEIRKLQITDSRGKDLTDSVLAATQAVLLLSYHPEKLTPQQKKTAYAQLKNPSQILAISPQLGAFAGMKNAFADATVLKTIARSNPALVVLNKGKIISKKPL